MDPIIQLLSNLGPNALLAGAVYVLWKENQGLKTELKHQAKTHGEDIKALYEKNLTTLNNWRKALEAHDDDHA